MTTGDVLRAVRTCWYVALVGVVLTLGCLQWVRHSQGVYFSEVQVYFIAPPIVPGQDRSFTSTSDGLVALAGLVERKVNNDATIKEPVSPSVSIADMGIRRGTVVLLPNSGGQWNYNFTRPLLQVQTVGSSPEDVAARRDTARREVEEMLREVQLADGVGHGHLVTTRLVPEEPTVQQLNGHMDRALAVVGSLGIGLTVFACVGLAGILKRRSHPAEPDETRVAAATSVEV